jgi:hypothetical protein
MPELLSQEKTRRLEFKPPEGSGIKFQASIIFGFIHAGYRYRTLYKTET